MTRTKDMKIDFYVYILHALHVLHGKKCKKSSRAVRWARLLCPLLEDMMGTAQLCAGQIYNCCLWHWKWTCNAVQKKSKKNQFTHIEQVIFDKKYFKLHPFW